MDNVKVTITLNDQFTGKLQKISNELINLERTTKKVSTAIERMTRFNEAAATSFKKLMDKATKSFSEINRSSLSNATSKVKHLTDQMNSLTQAAQQASAAVKNVSNSGSGSSGSGKNGGAPYSGLGTKVKDTAKKIAKGTFSAAKWIGQKGIALGKFAVSESMPGLQLSSDTEQENIAFAALLNSEEKAKSFNRELVNFTNGTPFELAQIRNASKQLLSSQMEPEDVKKTMKAVGNAATGNGTGSKGFEDITGALSRMRLDGSVTEKEMLNLVSSGIPAWDILATKMNKTTEQIKAMTKAGTLPATQAVNDLVDKMNQMSPEAMDKQGATLAGLFSVIKNTFNYELLERWGDGISKALQPRLQQLVTWINNNGATIARWGQTIQNWAFSITNSLSSKFEGVFTYIQQKYLNNSFFQKLTPPLQISFVISDLLSNFNKWLSSGGSEQIESITKTITESISNGLTVAIAPLFVIAYKLGVSIASGLILGLKQTIANHPGMSVLIGAATGAYVGAKVGKGYGALIGGVVGGVGGGLTSYFAKRSIERENSIKPEDFIKNLNDRSNKQIPSAALNPNATISDILSYSGLPNDGLPGEIFDFPSISDSQFNGNLEQLLGDSHHSDKPWRNNQTGSLPITFNFNYHGERMGEKEIDEMMGIFTRKLEAVAP
ncbi:tape measure protein [Paenibacillus sp. UNC451MF]|uniref:tape measure protein n=1 Tax=Paenibacillus sp. UNC451MF TaxID=1449063 RepID=UPI00068A0E37|nr:tape measure protein [Paenibacillus sp. UNC451MF]